MDRLGELARAEGAREDLIGVKPDQRLYGAMFLMATSAIGPGFITQTTQRSARV